MSGAWIRRSQGTLTALGELRRERRLASLPRHELLAHRDARVRDLVTFAAQTVPWYREAVASRSLDVRSVRTAADLELLPLVGREDLQERPRAFRPTASDASSGLLLRTTGSTATPLEVLHDDASVLASIAHAERTRAVEARFVGRRYRYRVLDVHAASGTTALVQAYYARELLRPIRPARHALTVASPPGEIVDALERARPHVFRSYGTFTELVFRTAASRGGLRFRPRVVVYAGDTMSTAGRELIERQFGVPVLSLYNAVECFHIAFTCEERSGFHVHEDLCHVRIADREGRTVPAGTRGEVVLSNLVNRGTVLLNYRLGDVARLDEAPCPCGRRSPRLVDLEGRIDEVIELDGGRLVYPTELWNAFRQRPGLLRYQLVQHARREFGLRVVTTGEEGLRAARAAAEDLRVLLDGAAVDVVPMTDLSSGPTGKFRHIVPLRSVRGRGLVASG